MSHWSFKKIVFLLALSPTVFSAELVETEAQAQLAWAYALNTPGFSLPADDGQAKRVPGSDLEFVFSIPRSLYNPPDWHPEDHPSMPDIVANGRNPGIFPCSYCHLPNGQGRPENTSLTGLPAEYIKQQMADYRAGLRRSSEPQHGPASAMLAIAVNASEAEVAEAAAYFSSLTPRRWIRVIETDLVPESLVAGWMYIEKEEGGTEPIGQRILEMPEDLERTELRDDRSGFIAYVPTGSVARGEQFVMSGGNGKSQPCAQCHGTDMKGLGPVPPLAGRSPSYLARQLFDFQKGNRQGLWSPLMQGAVENLNPEDIINISAYLASLSP